jgi:hypothetical protein
VAPPSSQCRRQWCASHQASASLVIARDGDGARGTAPTAACACDRGAVVPPGERVLVVAVCRVPAFLRPCEAARPGGGVDGRGGVHIPDRCPDSGREHTTSSYLVSQQSHWFLRKSDMATIIALGVTVWRDTPGVSRHSVTPTGPPYAAARPESCVRVGDATASRREAGRRLPAILPLRGKAFVITCVWVFGMAGAAVLATAATGVGAEVGASAWWPSTTRTPPAGSA